MKEKKVTIVLKGKGINKEVEVQIAPKTTTRNLMRLLNFPYMEISKEKGDPSFPDDQSLFHFVEDGSRLYASVKKGPLYPKDAAKVRRILENFVGIAADPATDVAEKHDLYLSGLLK